MLVELDKERIELARPVVTPVGPMDSVWSVIVTVGDGDRLGTGRVKCATGDTAERIVASAAEMVASFRLAPQALDDSTWAWWSSTWQAAAERSREGPELMALSGIDAALWDLAAPPRPSPTNVDARVYWSGFWLGESLDDAHREAARSVELGFDSVKMRCDARDLASSVARFGVVAEEVPPAMGIAVELAGSGTVEYVTRFVSEIDAARVLWIEDPVPPSERQDTARLAADLPVAIGGGESCWGTDALDTYLESTGLAFPIIDLGYCGGPSALAAFLDESGTRFEAIGVHLDATLTAHALARVDADCTVYIEVMDWWEHTTPRELREILASG